MPKKICIDPGHAKNTQGKRAGTNPTYYEYLSNRNIGKRLRKYLEDCGFDCIYSCDLDDVNDKSLAARGNTAVRMKCDLFVSIHSNAGEEAARGTETYIHTESKSSIAPATMIQESLVGELGTKNRGVKRANFGVLRGTYQSMYAILTEGEFFSNPEARKWMLTTDYEIRYARGVAKGICRFFEVPFIEEKRIPAPPSKVPPVVVAPDVGASIVRVKAVNLWTYDKPDWEAKHSLVHQREAFTVMDKIKVEDGYMYRLKSGLYITANPEYVELDGRVQQVTVPSPNRPAESAPIRPYPNRLFQLSSPMMRDGKEESDIQAIQRVVGVNPDGVYGPKTAGAVREYQKGKRLAVDGKVGRNTWQRMFS